MDTLMSRVERAVRRCVRLYVSKPTPADELAEDVAWERAHALYRLTPSTSETPCRCTGCGEWNDAARDLCRVCHQDIGPPRRA